jgi:MFS family permease
MWYVREASESVNNACRGGTNPYYHELKIPAGMSVKAESEAPATGYNPMQSAVSAAVPYVRLIFVLIAAAYFLDVIDASIVQVALPSIQRQWSVSTADLQWVYGAYALTIAGFLMLMGRAGDVYGQKKIFQLGLIIFTVASFSGGLAGSLFQLVIFRAIQGVGAAMTTVTAFALFIGIFPEGKARNRAFGVLIAILSGGFAAGAVVGGFLTVTFGWRSVMFVNAPIGLVSVLLCQRFLPNTKGWVQNSHLDVPGALTVTSGTILFVYAMTNAAVVGFASELTLIPLAVSAIILAAFVSIESRSKSPLLPLSFIRRGSILTANTLALVLTSIVGGISFILTIYMQNILNYTPEQAGLAILPGALIFFVVGGWGASRVMGKLGVRKTLLVSTALVTLGVLLMTTISVNGNYFTILPGLLIWATGASVGFPAVNIAAVSGTKHGEEGLASGVSNTSFRIGFPVGLAILLTIAGAFDPPAAAGATGSAANAGVVAGFQVALLAGALLGVLGFLLASRVKDAVPSWGQTPSAA